MASSSMLLLSRGAKCLEANRLSIMTPTNLCFATDFTKLHSACKGSVSERPEKGRCLTSGRFARKGLTTMNRGLHCFRMERGPVTSASCLEDEGPLNRNEVVELLSVAVHTLLKPENQKRLRDRLEMKSKLQSQQKLSEALELARNVDQYSSPIPTNPLRYLEEVGHAETEGDAATAFGRWASDQASLISESVNIPNTSQMSELVGTEGPSGSIETREFSTGSVEGKGDSSLTSIRRLKVLNVHSYVHNALRSSALRSWLQSRTIEE